MTRPQYRQIVDARHTDRPRYLPRRGKIGLGVKVAGHNGGERPREVPYFVLDDPSAHPIVDAFLDLNLIDAAKADAWKKGQRGPTSLPVVLPSNDPSVIFPSSYEAWGRSAKGNAISLCRGNGRTAHRLHRTGNNGDAQLVEQPCPCEWLDEGKCRPIYRLLFVIPMVDAFGVWQIDTSAISSYNQVRDDFEFIRLYYGRIAGLVVPHHYRTETLKPGEALLMLRRAPWTDTSTGQTHYRLHVEPRPMPYAELLGLAEAVRALPRMTDEPRAGDEMPRCLGNERYLDGSPAKALPSPAGIIDTEDDEQDTREQEPPEQEPPDDDDDGGDDALPVPDDAHQPAAGSQRSFF